MVEGGGAQSPTCEAGLDAQRQGPEVGKRAKEGSRELRRAGLGDWAGLGYEEPHVLDDSCCRSTWEPLESSKHGTNI